MKKLFFVSILMALLLVHCSNKSRLPKLVVFISIDQGTPSIINKYNHLFSGGYNWLLKHGIKFENAYHEHGITSTAPGHFALSSGRHPGIGGILGNQWFDRELKRGWYCVEDSLSTNLTDSSDGRSYRNIKFLGIGDWVKNKYKNSKIVSISGKDRAAIMLGGKNPDIAIWYDRKGKYTTSTYYSSKLPKWLKDFNSKLNVVSYLDTVWLPIYDEEIYSNNARSDYYLGETYWGKDGKYDPTFPISFKSMGEKSLLNNFHYTPFGDKALLDLAEISIEKYDLGVDYNPDILFLALSATDGVGHDNGPHSYEQLDTQLRLDKYLGDFINNQEDRFGKGNVLYILSSDHGVLELPEYLSEQGINSGRVIKVERDSIYNIALQEIRFKLGSNKVYEYENSFYFDNSMNEEDKNFATKILKKELIKITGIDSVATKYDLLNGGQDHISKRLKNMIHLDKSPDIYLILKKYWIYTSKTGTTHGSPYDYDAHIPLIFASGNTKSVTRNEYIRSIDIAPSLAKILNISYPKDINGRSIKIK